MTLQIDLWQLLGSLAGLTAAIIGAMWMLVKSNLTQYDRRLTEQFGAHEKAELQRMEALSGRVKALESADMAMVERLARLEAEKEDLGPVWERINDIAGSLSHLEGEFKGASDLLRMIHAKLMEKQ